MKTYGGAITVSQLMISFLLVAITPSGVVTGQKESVLDSRGNPVKANTEYYLRCVFEDRLMWINRYRSIIDAFSCPLIVALTRNIMGAAFVPVIFELSSDVVSVSTELNIKFSPRTSLCTGGEYWRVEDSSKAVVLEGSKSSNDSTFTIQKFGGSYKIAFGSADKPTNIGLERIVLEDYRLILSNTSEFSVSFSPALV